MKNRFQFSLRTLGLLALALAVGLTAGIVGDERDWLLVCQVTAGVLIAFSLLAVFPSQQVESANRFRCYLGCFVGCIMLLSTASVIGLQREWFGDFESLDRKMHWGTWIEQNYILTTWRLCLLISLWFIAPASFRDTNPIVRIAIVFVGTFAVFAKLVDESMLHALVEIAINGLRQNASLAFTPPSQLLSSSERWWLSIYSIFTPICLCLFAVGSISVRTPWHEWSIHARRHWWIVYGSILLALAAFATHWRLSVFPAHFPEYAEATSLPFDSQTVSGVVMASLVSLLLATSIARRQTNQSHGGIHFTLLTCVVALPLVAIGTFVTFGKLLYDLEMDWGLSWDIAGWLCKDSVTLVNLATLLLSLSALFRLIFQQAEKRADWKIASRDFWEALCAIGLLFLLGIPAIAMVGVCWWIAPFH